MSMSKYEYDVFQHVVALSLLSNNHAVKNKKVIDVMILRWGKTALG